MSQVNAARAAGKQPTYPSPEEIDKMVNDRQKVSDDLGHLTQQMRSEARELAPSQPAASNKLRSALDGMDENDLGTRLQRSSDWLRRGNFSDPLETALTSDLQKLGQQVKDAARALGSAQTRRKSQLSTWARPARAIRAKRRPTGSVRSATRAKRPSWSRWPTWGKSGEWGRRPTGRPGGQSRRWRGRSRS
jgi:hypothetical protein